METTSEVRTWAMHCSFMSTTQGPLFTNFGLSVQQVSFNSPSREARTLPVRLTEDATGEYLGMIKNGTLDPNSIRRFHLTDPMAGTPSERVAIFDFDGTAVRLRATRY